MAPDSKLPLLPEIEIELVGQPVFGRDVLRINFLNHFPDFSIAVNMGVRDH